MVIALGAKAKNKQRLVKFINYMYSSEYAYGMDALPPNGLSYKLVNNKPVLTDFGQKAVFDANGLKMPASWGGGDFVGMTYQTINYPARHVNATDPKTGESYNPRAWSSYRNRKLEKAMADWSSHMLGAKDTADYLKKSGKIDVAPGASFAPDEPSSQMQVVQGQIKSQIVQHSWKAVMAKNEAGFDSEFNTMVKQVQGLGYSDVEKFDAKVISEWRAAMKKAVADYNAKK